MLNIAKILIWVSFIQSNSIMYHDFITYSIRMNRTRNRKINCNFQKDKYTTKFINGGKSTYLNGKLHSVGDLPAVECPSGTKLWYKYGKRHRDNDLPAIEWIYGSKEWYQNGKCHRDGDLPAIECENGYKAWFKYGKQYSLTQIMDSYARLAHFGRLLLKKIRINRLKHKKWIHGELLCKPLKGIFLGGQDYHKMIDYFTKLS